MRVADFIYMNKNITEVTDKLEEYAGDGGRQISQDELKLSYYEVYNLIDSLRALSSAFMSIQL